MKKFFIYLGVIVSTFVLASTVLAVDLGSSLIKNAGDKAGYDKNTNETTLAANVGLVINIVLSVVGVLFTLLMIYAGYTWMTARGNEEKVEKSKRIITMAIIGLIITLGAYSITAYIIPRVLSATTSMNVLDHLFV